jgi:hypothetical protein
VLKFLKPWRKFNPFQKVFMRSIEKHKKHLSKRKLLFLVLFLEQQKKERIALFKVACFKQTSLMKIKQKNPNPYQKGSFICGKK